jgi:hypothetical protein
MNSKLGRNSGRRWVFIISLALNSSNIIDKYTWISSTSFMWIDLLWISTGISGRYRAETDQYCYACGSRLVCPVMPIPEWVNIGSATDGFLLAAGRILQSTPTRFSRYSPKLARWKQMSTKKFSPILIVQYYSERWGGRFHEVKCCLVWICSERVLTQKRSFRGN